MTNHRECLVQQFHDLFELLDENIEYIPDCEIEFLVREMAMMLEYIERHIDEEG